MDIDREQPEGRRKADLVRLAGDALPLTEQRDSRRESKETLGRSPSQTGRPTRPTVHTERDMLQPRHHHHQWSMSTRDHIAQRSDEGHLTYKSASPHKISRATTDGSSLIARRPEHRASFSGPLTESASGPSRSHHISPVLRRNTVFSSERSIAQTLPPLQRHTSPANSAKAGNGPESLPSLAQADLKDLMNSTLPVRDPYRDLGRSPSIPVTLPPPPMASKAHPSPKSRVNSTLSAPFPHGQPSPVLSDRSPRGLSIMSPPDKPTSIFANYQFGQPAALHEELTPQSAQSLPSSSSYGTVPSPQIGPTSITGTFKCTHKGCTASPFHTQYLLNSHENVHSQRRPHYCPVPNCNRAEGGKGFKRKNEMIRHGLVHDSPGYICPFCPEREHKYPRPDNLQRHVRVNHVGKDMNDPLLREVLSQRIEGGSRGRRRRIGST